MDGQSISEDYLKTALAERIQAIHVDITDMSGASNLLSPPGTKRSTPGLTAKKKKKGGCGQAFSALIVSPEFAGKNSLKRHRLVNSALKEEIAAIHAWTAKCQTPEEWQRDKAAKGSGEPSLEGTVGGKVDGTTA